MKEIIKNIFKNSRVRVFNFLCIILSLSIISGTVIAMERSPLRILLLKPFHEQEFQIDQNGPAMPEIELEARLNDRLEGAEYRFVIGNPETGHALEYEDAYDGYEHPAIIDSGWLKSSKWTIPFGMEVFGGHVTHITVSVRKNRKIILTKVIKRDFYIVGSPVPQKQCFEYIDSLTHYSKNIRNMAKAISIQESHGHHFWTEGVYGEASHNGYPLKEINGGGYGLMQLTSKEFLSRETIWNWKKNIDVATSYIQKCYMAAVTYLDSHPEEITDKMIKLEAYNRYNGGLSDRYHWWSDGQNPKVTRGWVKFSYIPVGKVNKGWRDYNNDGEIDPAGNPWNIPPRQESGTMIGGPNTIARRAARYADKVFVLAQFIQ